MPVGIDIASGKFDVAVWKGDTSYKTKVFPNTPKGFIALKKWLEPFGCAISAWRLPARTVSRWPPSCTTKAMMSAWKILRASGASGRPS
ncbi:hypothetical protein E05_45810 [Plautia stali symbiont]|nr:hypothetical protein E05_09800 [Plautia stali symbiont]BAN95850.1 hypothetical protein E05_10840 [Plautia stali symbiont]BAN96896.1 hypothetical protein E05_21300 [Plautia stali symbiont]BAN96922.1 hypothetical protein E05_21560 [Plautia stali symbiont]BAN99347.1 hypothetical protein E05_45810 [Plautia stali symbiont]